MVDTRWIEQRGRAFYAVRDVPRPLRTVLGKRRFVKSLGTRDLHVAIARRHAALAEFQREIAAATQGVGSNTLVQEGLAWKETLAAIDRGDLATVGRFSGPQTEIDESGQEVAMSPQRAAKEVAEMVLHERLDELRFFQDRKEDAALLAGVAKGYSTPLLTHVDAWLLEGGARGPVRPRTQQQYRSDLQGLADWLQRAGVPAVIESVTKPVVGRYVSEAMVGAGVHRKTANRKISAASSYWRWLTKRTGLEINPWVAQSLPKVRRPGEKRPKRAFDDAEMRALLAGNAGAELADLIRVAALSGMRIEEIYRLTVADCAGGWFNIRETKSHAGVRRVPIHSALAPIVKQRTKRKPVGAYLFHEAGPMPPPPRERSMPASKRFGHYRKRVGVDEPNPGSRQGRIDFHSLRRWFTTAARNAGVDQATVAAVIGHEVGNLTDDVYSAGPDERLLRACVEAVRLPARTGAP